MSGQEQANRDFKREKEGWVSLVLIMLLFPVLFFACVFFPIWLGVASPY